ncbi:hypothetical protein JM93_02825 [Roseibium hamelinense]|uniref:Uncharacterized protein n=1 Tax=Roseibium hamelinense TaxID=150831 RepID=A0A562SXP9_9HYPH|nr:hypothetical protein [Roseibium hamelinense]MTI43601.1 hypothetical protein [Roseibium hamelinense]TWI86117.1 hypothetical protein JM93_02825 [Roseibium hamelinense]
MSARFPMDPFSDENGSDVQLPIRPEPVGARFFARRLALVAARFLFALVIVTALFYVPMLIHELGQIETVITKGSAMRSAGFTAHIIDLLIGTAVFSFALLSALVAALLVSKPVYVWRVPKTEPQGEDETILEASATLVRMGKVRNV